MTNHAAPDMTTIKRSEWDDDWLIWDHKGECIGRTSDVSMAAEWCRDWGYEPFRIIEDQPNR